MPNLNPVGHQSTNWTDLLDLICAIAALQSLGMTSPLKSMQQDMYFPVRGSHFTIWLPGSKHEFVNSETDKASWKAFSAEMIGAYVANGKWIRGYGTKLVSKVRYYLKI